MWNSKNASNYCIDQLNILSDNCFKRKNQQTIVSRSRWKSQQLRMKIPTEMIDKSDTTEANGFALHSLNYFLLKFQWDLTVYEIKW